MGYRAYKTLITLVHTWYATPYLLVPPQRSGATLRRNPGLAGAQSNVSSPIIVLIVSFLPRVFGWNLGSIKTMVWPTSTKDSPPIVRVREFLG